MMFINELFSAILQILLFSFVPFLVWLIKYRKKENYFAWIGLKKVENKDSKKIVKWIAIVFVFSFIIGEIAILLRGEVEAADSMYKNMGIGAIPTVLIYSFIHTALSEEILFRGFILKRLSNKLGFKYANFIQGFIFGLLHLVLIWGQVGVLAGIVIFIYPIITAMLLGFLNEKVSSGSILPSCFVHGLLNTVSQLIQVL